MSSQVAVEKPEVSNEQLEEVLKALTESEHCYAEAQRIAHVGSWDWNLVTGDLAWSKEVYRIFGLEPARFYEVYDAFLASVHPDDREPVLKAVNEAVDQGMPYDIEHRVVRPDGSERIVHEKGQVYRDDNGKPVRMIGVVHDITERKRAENKIELASKIFEHAIEGVLITDPDGVIELVNPAFTAITGYESKEVIGKKPSILKSDRHDKKFYEQMWSELLTSGQWKGEIWNRRKNGEAFPEWQSITAIKDSIGKVIQYAAVFHDITDVKRQEEEIKYQAYHDPLTGLPNRLLLKDRLNKAIARSHRDKRSLAVIFLDLDNFKNINNSLGHTVGDQLLQAVAQRLKASVKEGDTVSRFGGDEFVLILDSAKDEKEIENAVLEIMKAISKPHLLKSGEFVITASLGITIYPQDGGKVEDLIRNCDMAMFRAKELGKNTFQFFTPDMNEKVKRHLELESKMRRAIEKDEFVVHYQPKVNVIDRKITGMEALVRWPQPDGSVVSPGEFIPLAEESDLIKQIGERVLAKACEFTSALHDKGYNSLTVSVNISARQLDDEKLAGIVKSTLDKTGLKPESLYLELTESAMMKDPEKALETLNRLKSIGIKISMDDFGTGFSSLSQLKKFPIDELKIDQSFIRSIPEDKDDMAIAATITSMTRALGLDVIAEGVESTAQLDYLNSIGCHNIQGYIFSPPLGGEEFEKLLKKDFPEPVYYAEKTSE